MMHGETNCLGYTCFQESLCNERSVKTKRAHVFGEMCDVLLKLCILDLD